MFKADNSFNVLIGKDISRTSSVQVTDKDTGATFIASGEILVLDEDGNPLTPGDTYADTKSITIVQGTGTTTPMKSSLKIDGNAVITAQGTSYSAAAEQQSFVGYDSVATSGSIDAQPFTTYKMTIVFRNNTELFSEQLMRRTFSYTTGASTTQSAIATEFASQINAEDWPGVTATVVNSGSDYGIRLDGDALTFDFATVGDFRYDKVAFEVLLNDGFGATTNTTPTTADRGNGVPEIIAELEWAANGFEGATNRVHHPATPGYSDVDSTLTYDVINIEYFLPSKVYPVSGAKPGRGQLIMALPVDASQTSDVLAQLNPWLASLPTPFATIAV